MIVMRENTRARAAALTAIALTCAAVLGTGPASAAEASADATSATGNSAAGAAAASATADLPVCPDSLHDAYTATGPDGEVYPTWHPASVTDPDTGVVCAFGHEHGDDPASSDIFDWTMEKRGGGATGVTFGYATHMSSLGEGGPHRHEDHYGHKVFVLNDVNLVREDREGYVRDGEDQPVTCDYLIHVHQGTHSADALSNNQHEVLYATRCSDGTEMVVNTLTGFGDANEYATNCDGRTVSTGGSDLPDGSGGSREIPDVVCVEETGDEFWGVYEVWKADHSLTDEAGEEIVRFDPWFGVRNPSRVADGADAVDTIGLAGEALVGWPWGTVPDGAQKNDPDSPFTGDQRDVYVQRSTVDNAGGASTLYTDAYGQTGATSSFEGAIAQYIAPVSNTDLAEPQRQAFGFSTDYGAGHGVHAPN